MTARPNAPPRIQDRAVRLKNEHLIAPVIPDHEQPSIFDLYHLVTVQNRVMSPLSGWHPVLMHPVTKGSMANNGVFFGIRRGTELLHPQRGGGCAERK